MEDKEYPNFRQGLVLTIFSVLLGLAFHILLRLPIYLRLEVPDFYASLAHAISSFIAIPIILYALKKSKMNLLDTIRYPNFFTCSLLIFIAVSVAILTIPFKSPIMYYRLILNGQLGFYNFKPLEFDLNSIIKYIHGFLLGPVLEEIFFRGILLQQFLKRYSPLKAILFSALLFASSHLRLLDQGSIIIYGIILGYIFYKTNSIVSCILVHSIFNLIMSSTKRYIIQMDFSSLLYTFIIISTCVLIIYLFSKNIDRIQKFEMGYRE